MTPSPSIVWFRNDLRLFDNPALHAAVARGESLVLLYVHDEESPGSRPLGGATKWWLHHSLISLQKDIEALGGLLTLRRGHAAAVVREVAAQDPKT